MRCVPAPRMAAGFARAQIALYSASFGVIDDRTHYRDHATTMYCNGKGRAVFAQPTDLIADFYGLVVGEAR
jgi:hypothetical protein